MTTQESPTIVGVFQHEEQARAAMTDLHNAGFSEDQLGFVRRNPAPASSDIAAEQATTEKGAAAGGVTGGVIGGLLGAAAALFIPGIGPVIAGGILGATIGGIVIGAAAGGLIGALTHLGVPEEHARYYNEEVESGRTLVTVNPGTRGQEALNIIRRNGAYDAVNRIPETQAYATGEAALPGEGANRAAYDPALGSPTSPTPNVNATTNRSSDIYDPDATVIRNPSGSTPAYTPDQSTPHTPAQQGQEEPFTPGQMARTRPSQFDDSTGRYAAPNINQGIPATREGQYDTLGNPNDPNAPVRREVHPGSTVMPNEHDLSATDAEIARDRNPASGENYQ